MAPARKPRQPLRRTRTPVAAETAGRPWRVTILRAIAPEGELAWPDHNDLEAYRDLWESGGSAYFNCVWMQEPSGLAGEVFRPEWFRYYVVQGFTETRRSRIRPGQMVTLTAEELLADEETDVHAILPDRRELLSLQACDLAIRQSDTADWYARMNAYASRQGELYVADVHRGRYTETEMVADIIRAADHHNAKAVGIESVAFQSLVFRMVARKSFRHFVELDPAGRDKVLRARPFAARYQMGKVFHAYGARWRQAYEYELQEFPHGRWDDQVDCGAYLAEMAMKYNPDTWREIGRMQREMRQHRRLDDVVARAERIASAIGTNGRGTPR